MATRDITRSAYARTKRYLDLHAQQGRLFTDSDQVEQAETRFEEDRLTRLDTIGPFGSPDEGFRITDPQVVGGQIDFTIGAGTLYLGGFRLERLEEETFRLQSDWLNNPGATPPAEGGTRRDLVVAATWLQPVAATEDRESLEPGLGGPDTTVRLRPVTRATIITGIGGETCEEAWAEAVEMFADQGLGTLDESYELVPDTEFTIGLEPGTGGEDLCSPSVDGGYLGAENQAIRVVLTGEDRFIWGFDNAAPLYRVVVEEGGTTLRFLTEPKDALHWPAPGQTVEVIPWGAVLANGEKIADESRPGHFALVEGGYAPDSREITLTPATAVPVGFGTEWQARADAADLLTTRYGLETLDGPYYFLRVWDRGTDSSAEPSRPLLPAPAALGATGLNLTLGGSDQRAGDHVIVAARPATTDVLMPWQLMVGAPPLGLRRFVAPLALIEWEGEEGSVLHDCRPRFRPLTRQRNCCTYTVGDGNQSFGDFDTIGAAIAALPPGGGQICVLPGVYPERLHLAGRTAVRITGCGRRSRITTPDEGSEPLLLIEGGGELQIDDLAFEATFGPAIVARGLIEEGQSLPVTGLRLLHLLISARDRGAIDARFVDALTIAECRITILMLARNLGSNAPAGQAPAVFALGDTMAITDNAIRTLGERALVRAAGGLQIGGGSDGVLIRDNLIEGGNGNGITLGHIVMLPRETAANAIDDYTAVAGANPAYIGGYIIIDENGCITHIPPGSDRDPDEEEEPEEVPVSGGDLSEVVIRDNRLAGMGLSGIASPLAILHATRLPVMVTIRGLQIDRNIITGCAQLETPELAPDLRLLIAFGGIALTSVEIGLISGNVIEANGRRHINAIVGISLLRSESLAITDNRIVDNGPRTGSDAAPRIGLRGGIRIASAGPQSSALSSAAEVGSILAFDERFAAARALSVPALTIHDNVVQQPLGKALQVLGMGPMSILGNHLASQGTTTGSLEALLAEIFERLDEEDFSGTDLLFLIVERLLGTAVTIVNLGFASELIEGLALLSLLKGRYNQLQVTNEPSTISRVPTNSWAGAGRLLQGGVVAFNDNTVIQNFLDGQPSLTLSSVFVLSFDDVSVQDNTMVSHIDFASDFCLANFLGFAWSIRACGNRFEETLFRTLNSAYTLGFFNDTSHNQATHCIEAAGPAPLLIDGPNRALVQALNPLACGGCLTPPFTGLAMEARSANGALVTPRLHSFAGMSGLWFASSLLITLPGEVEEVELSFAGEDVQLRVAAERANGQIVREAFLQLGTATTQLAGDSISRLRIEASAERAVMTRLCSERPQFGSASGAVTGSSFLSWEG